MPSVIKLELIGLKRVVHMMVIVSMVFGNINIVSADYQDLEVPTQVNKRTNYLYESDGNPDQLMKNYTHSLDDMKGIIGDDNGNKAIGTVSEVSGVDSNQARAKSSELQSLDNNSAASRGRAEMAKNNTMKELYMNWDDDPHRQYLKEAKDIGEAQDNLINNLQSKLRELGIDCKKLPGNIEKEPEFYLKVREKPSQDTKYNQHFCEHRLNKYNCNYKRYVRCRTYNQSMKWYKWQRVQTRTFRGSEIWHHHNDWFKDVEWKRDKRRHQKYWCYLRTDGGTFNNIANYIAAQMGKKAGHVRVIGTPSDRGEGRDWGGGDHHHFSNTYRVQFQYRDGDP
ncbi:MAG: hypothetical protein GY694_00380, partial [Gammaproteobacteria bacterium]|nr:hypothetical protein [Gammaproteobacteria bacterium]